MPMAKFTFTLVVPIFNAEPYLFATLKSLNWQDFPASQVQIILVDDGSTDHSPDIATKWASTHPNTVFLTQSHAGVSEARNRALDLAEGEWFSSVDSDDILDKHYLRQVAGLLRRDTQGIVSAVATRLLMLNSETGRWADTHALGNKFHFGDRLARLQEEPDAFALSSTTFMRTAVLNENKLRYDPSVTPTFEDGHLLGRYLACFPDPVMGIASTARYYYRQRVATHDSLTQTTWQNTENYTTVPEAGYLGMLRAIHERLGTTPTWAQYMILYNLMWYVKEEQAMYSKTAWVDAETARQFLTILESIMEHIDTSTIERFPYPQLLWSMRQALIVRFKDDGTSPRAFALAKNGTMAGVDLLYRGDQPELEAYSGTQRCEIEVLGQRSHMYFGQEWMVEATLAWDTHTTKPTSDSLWVSGRRAVLGSIRRVQRSSPPRPTFRLETDTAPARSRRPTTVVINRAFRLLAVSHAATGRPRTIIAIEAARRLAAKRKRQRQKLVHARWVESIKQRAASPDSQRLYADAWVIMDRPDTADDNGEHLYRYVLNARPDINAYFFLAKTSPHRDRLAAEGFRLIDYGSDEAALITLNSVVRASSDAVEQCMHPIPVLDFGELPGMYVFLQHGVIVSDLSRWLNGKKIALMTTSTFPEYSSITGQGSPYSILRNHVGLLGLARWDQFMSLRQTKQHSDTILVAPTWRANLAEALDKCPDQASRYALFEESEYGSRWLDLLRSPALAASRKQIHLVLHHRMNSLLPAVDLPAQVTQLPVTDVRYQQELSRAALLITDYSSIAFDAAYLGLPLVYYQFDADHFYADHSSRAGYFHYGRDGFGPVVTTLEEVNQAITDAATSGYVVNEPYRTRVRETFAYRDTNNCQRTVDAIEKRLATLRQFSAL